MFRNMLSTLLHVALLQIITTSPVLTGTAGLLSQAQFAKATALLHDKVKEVAPQILHITDAWGIPAAVYRDTPAAGQWGDYNKDDNQGEIIRRARL